MARPHPHPRTICNHPVYSDDSDKQKTIEEGVDAQYHSIMDLVEVVIHKRLTQFAECLIEGLNKREQANGQG